MSTCLISKGWIDNSLYPESKIFFDNRQIVLDELNYVLSLDLDIWPIQKCEEPYRNKYNSNTDNKRRIIKETAEWRICCIYGDKNFNNFGDDFHKTIDITKYFNKTIKFLTSNSNRIRCFGISMLQPKSKIPLHYDTDYPDINSFKQDYNYYRIHIPLIIPSNNNHCNKTILTKEEASGEFAVLQIENDYRLWKDNDYFIADHNNYIHSAWNNTNENRFLLLIDVYK